MTTSFDRVTRSSAARLAENTSNSDIDNEPSPATYTSAAKRKRTRDQSEASPQESVTSKRRKTIVRGEGDSNNTSHRTVKRNHQAANMSSAAPSSSNSETSPQSAQRESHRKRSHRRKSKEDHSATIPATSRRSKRGSRKDHDTSKDEDGRATDEEPAETTVAHIETNTAADGPEETLRKLTEELSDRGGHGDPFAGGYLSRLVGQSGLAGLSSHLRALSGMSSSTGNRLRTIIEQLKAKDDSSLQLIALQELSELLLVSNEDNLAGQFPPDQLVKELVALMQPNDFTGEENPEIMLLACRCIANLMEALPAATSSVVYGGAVPILCQKLLEIHFIDLAEQALSTLEKISIEYPSSIVREGGLTACLTYLEFFATSTQRTAVTTAANCCRNIPDESFATVRDVMPILLNTLSSNDQRVVEQASLCVSRIVDSFKFDEPKLEELVSADLLRAILRLLLPGTTNMISSHIHTSFLRVLSITARASSRLSVELLKMDVVDTLYQILTGVSPPAPSELDLTSKIDKNIIMQAIIRTPREQVFETLNVICEILPTLPDDDPISADEIRNPGTPAWSGVGTSTRSKKQPNDTRVELLKGCPAEVKKFAVILFPTLMHAYTSTVNLQVRQKVLTAQLKMLFNFDTNILKEALKDVTYASHLASILSQQDNPTLITYALQAAELLLQRLGDIYKPRFAREGVYAEITTIAERPLSADARADSDGEAGRNQDDEPTDLSHEHDAADVMDLDIVDIVEQHDEIVEDDEDEDNQVDNEHDDDEAEEDEEDEADHEQDDENSDESEGHLEEAVSNATRIANVQDLNTLRAQRFVHAYSINDNDSSETPASSRLQDLRQLTDKLRTAPDNESELYRELARYFDGDSQDNITSFELIKSGVIEALLDVLTSTESDLRNSARKRFAQAFMSANNATENSAEHKTAFSVLLQKLQELLSRSEQFEVVTVHHNAFESNRASAASMLAKQLRIQLVADEQSEIPKVYHRIMVSIHAIATFSALNEYLRPRISMAERPRGGNRDPGSLAHAAAMTREKLGLPPLLPSVPSLASSLSNRDAPVEAGDAGSDKDNEATPKKNVSVKDQQAQKRSSTRHVSQEKETLAVEDDVGQSVHTPVKASQDTLECADETQLRDEDDSADFGSHLDALVDDFNEEQFRDEEPDPSAVNMEVNNSGKVTARTDDGARVSTPSQHDTPTPAVDRERLMHSHARLAAAREMLSTPLSSSSARSMSYASALQQPPQDWHIEFSINGRTLSNDTTIYRACHLDQIEQDSSPHRNVWSTMHTISYKRVEGPAKETSTTSASAEDTLAHGISTVPASLSKHPVTGQILGLMSILHELNQSVEHIGCAGKQLTNEPLTQFVNTKLTAKLNRQLEEPLIVASNCLPSWSEDLARLYPFLFPFETRHVFLSSTSFGYSRSMTRWQTSTESDGRQHGRHHRDERPFLGRLQRQKVRISRHRILESAIKVMEMYGSSPSVLEVEYFEEVGTGLGPTLEFYSNVSKEFSKKKTKLWRENESHSGNDYAFGRKGLFPAPMTEATSTSETGQRVLHLFKVLGKFVARSMLDSRIIDVSFNPSFFRIGTGGMDDGITAVTSVDHDLARSLTALKKFVDAKEVIEADATLDEAAKQEKLGLIRVNDAHIDDLALDFTLPGYSKIELIPGGGDIAVTLDNVSGYIERVIDLTIGSGVRRQLSAFAAGFSQVFPFVALRAFTPDELVMLFGRVKEDWSLETLMDSIKADHGYNLDSKSVRNLLQVMSQLSDEEKRGFLQFVTGSPKLPIGGFKSLTPMFTVVCKPAEPPLTSDDYLPSVMTCVNYLKMPDYSSLEVLKNKLNTAIREGQGSFHLS